MGKRWSTGNSGHIGKADRERLPQMRRERRENVAEYRENLLTGAVRELTYADLENIGWDYACTEVAGLYKGKEVMYSNFLVKQFDMVGGDCMRSGVYVQTCDIIAGTVTYCQMNNGRPERDETGARKMFTRTFVGDVNIYDRRGNLLETLVALK